MEGRDHFGNIEGDLKDLREISALPRTRKYKKIYDDYFTVKREERILDLYFKMRICGEKTLIRISKILDRER